MPGNETLGFHLQIKNIVFTPSSSLTRCRNMPIFSGKECGRHPQVSNKGVRYLLQALNNWGPHHKGRHEVGVNRMGGSPQTVILPSGLLSDSVSM